MIPAASTKLTHMTHPASYVSLLGYDTPNEPFGTSMQVVHRNEKPQTTIVKIVRNATTSSCVVPILVSDGSDIFSHMNQSSIDAETSEGFMLKKLFDQYQWGENVTSVLWSQQKGTCNVCRSDLQKHDIEKDHVIPLCCGGDDEVRNMQLLCGSCHNIKTAEDRIRYMVWEWMVVVTN